MSRPRRTFEDRFEELLAEATYEQLKYMADFSAAQVRLADRRLGSKRAPFPSSEGSARDAASTADLEQSSLLEGSEK